ncbi:MAG TPA: hypothetical protein DEF47_01820 [Herpetosiphon sp.]|nr:hypothetical protein [Herpetosiphon sp.]
MSQVREIDGQKTTTTTWSYDQRLIIQRIDCSLINSTIKQDADLLLQVRTQVLNGDWEATVRGWYAGFRTP